jgi:hypothetical protein
VPSSCVSHSSLVEDISALSVLFAIKPFTGVDILVRVGVEAFTLFLSINKLA